MRTSRLAVVAAVVAGAVFAASGSTPLGIRTATSVHSGQEGRADSVRVPLRYGPTWLPDGLIERSRMLSSREPDHARIASDVQLYRTWWPALVEPTDTTARVSMAILPNTNGWGKSCEGGRTVDINGVAAAYRRWDTKACVYWPIDSKTYVSLEVGGAGVDPDDALRVARSVRPVDGDCVVPFRLLRRDFEDGGAGGTYVRITGTSPTDWIAETMISPTSRNDPRGLTITLGTTTTAPPGGSDRPVGGRPGRQVSESTAVNSNFLVLDVDPGLLLTVQYWRHSNDPPPVTELVKVAERMRISTPDMSWIGTR